MNVNGREPVLNPGPLSRRADKSSTTPRSATKKIIYFDALNEKIASLMTLAGRIHGNRCKSVSICTKFNSVI